MRLNLAWSDGDPRPSGFGQQRPHQPLLTLAERAGLDAAPWFQELPAAARNDIARHCEVRTLRSGSAVYGQEAPGLCGIASGAASIRLHTAGAGVIDYLPAGTWILDPSALAGGPPFLRIEAHRRATVARLPREALREVLHRHPACGTLMQALGYAAVRRVTPILDDLARLPLKSRVARCVLRLCDNFGAAQAEGTRIALVLHQDEIGQMARASRQRVNLELKALEAAGVLQVAKQIVVCDRALLEAAAS